MPGAKFRIPEEDAKALAVGKPSAKHDSNFILIGL